MTGLTFHTVQGNNRCCRPFTPFCLHFLGKKYTNCFVTVENIFAFTIIITKHIHKRWRPLILGPNTHVPTANSRSFTTILPTLHRALGLLSRTETSSRKTANKYGFRTPSCRTPLVTVWRASTAFHLHILVHKPSHQQSYYAHRYIAPN